jgi:hypothetical protein
VFIGEWSPRPGLPSAISRNNHLTISHMEQQIVRPALFCAYAAARLVVVGHAARVIHVTRPFSVREVRTTGLERALCNKTSFNGALVDVFFLGHLGLKPFPCYGMCEDRSMTPSLGRSRIFPRVLSDDTVLRING